MPTRQSVLANERQNNGICRACTLPAIRGKKLCQKHRDEQKERMKHRYRRLIADKLCVMGCGNPASIPDRRCATCIVKYREKAKLRYHANKAKSST